MPHVTRDPPEHCTVADAMNGRQMYASRTMFTGTTVAPLRVRPKNGYLEAVNSKEAIVRGHAKILAPKSLRIIAHLQEARKPIAA